MWINNLNPTLLDLGPVEIRWYGLVYLLGFALSIWWLKRAQKQGMIHLSTDDLWDLALYLLIGVLVGSRVFELFWEPQYYLSNPLNILKIWQGGMSFHGGFVGIIAACWWYCKKKKVQFGIIADVLSAPLMFALALGRLANFVNGELVGRVWNGSWCVVFPQ
ncbi:MAG: prolipoprotein diacylglyceryl transferase, partial [Nanoarchaeota archaeon]